MLIKTVVSFWHFRSFLTFDFVPLSRNGQSKRGDRRQVESGLNHFSSISTYFSSNFIQLPRVKMFNFKFPRLRTGPQIFNFTRVQKGTAAGRGNQFSRAKWGGGGVADREDIANRGAAARSLKNSTAIEM
jgi:hypothetical protein